MPSLVYDLGRLTCQKIKGTWDSTPLIFYVKPLNNQPTMLLLYVFIYLQYWSNLFPCTSVCALVCIFACYTCQLSFGSRYLRRIRILFVKKFVSEPDFSEKTDPDIFFNIQTTDSDQNLWLPKGFFSFNIDYCLKK